jgi:hypothetical protein
VKDIPMMFCTDLHQQSTKAPSNSLVTVLLLSPAASILKDFMERPVPDTFLTQNARLLFCTYRKHLKTTPESFSSKDRLVHDKLFFILMHPSKVH